MEMGFNLLRGITTIKGLAAREEDKEGEKKGKVNFPRVTLAWLPAMSGNISTLLGGRLLVVPLRCVKRVFVAC